MKRKIKNAFFAAFGLLPFLSTISCKEIKEEEYDGRIEGAYFITDQGYETYIKKLAKSKGNDGSWVSKVLRNGEDSEDSSVCAKKNYWCVIEGQQISIHNTVGTVYDFYLDNEKYNGHNAYENISFWNEGNILHIENYYGTLDFKKNYRYIRDSSRDFIVEKPEDIEISNVQNQITFKYVNGGYGAFGATVDVKYSTVDDYIKTNDIQRPWMNFFIFEFDIDCFPNGDNYFRIYNLGGPYITDDGAIIVMKNSDYSTICLKISNGEILEKTQI